MRNFFRKIKNFEMDFFEKRIDTKVLKCRLGCALSISDVILMISNDFREKIFKKQKIVFLRVFGKFQRF